MVITVKTTNEIVNSVRPNYDLQSQRDEGICCFFLFRFLTRTFFVICVWIMLLLSTVHTLFLIICYSLHSFSVSQQREEKYDFIGKRKLLDKSSVLLFTLYQSLHVLWPSSRWPWLDSPEISTQLKCFPDDFPVWENEIQLQGVPLQQIILCSKLVGRKSSSCCVLNNLTYRYMGCRFTQDILEHV